MNAILLLVAAAVGFLLPFQAGVNARLARVLPTSLHAALVSFSVGTLALVLLALLWPKPAVVRPAIASAPWWAWVGGLIGAGYVAASVVLAKRLGAMELLSASVAGSMLGSLVIDRFGLVGFASRGIGLGKVLGAVLVVAGVLLIARPWEAPAR